MLTLHLNTKFFILITKFFILNTKFIILNTRFIIYMVFHTQSLRDIARYRVVVEVTLRTHGIMSLRQAPVSHCVLSISQPNLPGTSSPSRQSRPDQPEPFRNSKSWAY